MPRATCLNNTHCPDFADCWASEMDNFGGSETKVSIRSQMAELCLAGFHATEETGQIVECGYTHFLTLDDETAGVFLQGVRNAS